MLDILIAFITGKKPQSKLASIVAKREEFKREVLAAIEEGYEERTAIIEQIDQLESDRAEVQYNINEAHNILGSLGGTK